MIEGAVFGFLGGAVRAIVGVMKSRQRGEEFGLYYLVSTLLMCGIIGIGAGLLTDGDYRMSILAGYAGIDFIEGLYKMRGAQ